MGEEGSATPLLPLLLNQSGQAEPAWRYLKVGGGVKRSAGLREVPCAGTVTVAVLECGEVELRPLAADHDRVIGLWANLWCHGEVPYEPCNQVDARGELVDIEAFMDSHS